MRYALRSVLMASALMLAVTAASRVLAEEVSTERKPYVINGGETVRLVVPASLGESLVQTIYDDGLISLPTGSAVNIRGKTLSEAQGIINKKLAEDSSLKNVSAVLVVTAYPARKVFVNGEVKIPQALAIVPGADLNLASALTTVGGVLSRGDLTHVNLVRIAADGSRKAQIVDASKFGQPGNSDLGPNLQPGDVITVPRGAAFILAGEVTRPGVITSSEISLKPGEQPRASRILFATGGLGPAANRRSVRIYRNTEQGHQAILNVDLDAPSSTGDAGKEGASDSDPVLQDGDMLVVGASRGVVLLGRVRTPGLFPTAAGGMKLSHLIAQAGGFVEFAKTSSVTVTRAGTHEMVKVDVGSIIKDGQLDRDVDVEDGDVVYVGGGVL